MQEDGVSRWLYGVESRLDGETFDAELANKGEELFVEGLSKAWFGYKPHKWAIVATAIAATLVWVVSIVVFVGLMGSGLIRAFLIGSALGATSVVLWLVTAGLCLWLYQRLYALFATQAVQLIEHILVYVFGVSPDNRILRAVMSFGARFIWSNLERDARL